MDVDKYEHFNYEQDKFVNGHSGGKNRSKRESCEHTNRKDPSGHTRKITTKLQNTETNRLKK